MKTLEEYIANQAAPINWDEQNQLTIRRAREKKYAETRKKWHNQYRLTTKGRAAHLLASAKARAQKKGLAFDLDLEWIIERMEKPCPKTGVEFRLVVGSGRHWNAPSLDRIDNTKGYTKDNCQIVIDMYNICKSNYHENQVLEFAKAVLDHVNRG